MSIGAKRFAFASEQDKSAYFLHFADTLLKVLRYQPGQDKKITVKEYTLPRPLAGTPCLGTDCLVLPLDNGVLERVPLGDGPTVHGPTWRAAAAEEGTQGHVVALGANDFVYAVSASADGAVVASGCEDGVVRVYNGTNAQLVKAALPPDAEPKKDEPKK